MAESTSESELSFGPVEILLIDIDGDPFDDQLWQLVADSVDDDHIRVLDAAVVRRLDDETVEFLELDADPSGGAVALEVLASGLLADEDLEELAEDVETGASAVVVAIEHVWARSLASRLLQVGGAVVATERIPAPVVQAVFDELTQAASDDEGNL